MTDLPDDLRPSEHTYEVMIWHDVVHERLENLRLSFFRLSFKPSYDHDRIFETLAAVFERLEISSHIAYQTLGEYDLLLRLWVPAKREPEEVELMLWDALKDLRLWNIDHFRAHTFKHHAQGESPELERPVSDDAVRDVNAFNEQQGKFIAVPRTPLIQDLVDRRWIAPVRTDARGLRMFITFDHPTGAGFNPPRRTAALNLIRAKCEEVDDRWLKVRGVRPPQISIYSGGGSMTDFLIMARAPHPRFHAFVRDLVLGLLATDLSSVYGIRTYTHVMADRMFTSFAERRVPVGYEDVIDPEAAESESLEYKATLSLDIRALLVAGRRKSDSRRISAVTRAVCGMLNAPSGGRLVIGILEAQRESEHHEDPKQVVDLLSALFGYDPQRRREATPPGRFPNAVIGIEAEVGDGNTYVDSDQYVRRVLDALRTQIDPSPLPWLRVDLAPLEERTVCVVTVRPADVWFYAKSDDGRHFDFVVREAASSRVYSGPLMDSYKRAHPRRDA